MSIKKDVERILKEGGAVRLNEVATLERWTVDGMGDGCDCLMIHFSHIMGVKGGRSYAIESRDYEGILEEINNNTMAYLVDCANESAKNLKNGIR